MTFENKRVAVVLPAYEEAGRIGRVLASIQTQAVADACIVISDASRDGTAREAELAGADVLILPFHLGYGAALQTGIRYAFAKGFDYLVTMDADGQHSPADLPRLLAEIQKGAADLVIGSRFPDSDRKTVIPLRYLGILFFRCVLKLASGRTILDPTSGFLAMGRDAMRFCLSDGFPTDYPDANALLMMSRAGLKIREVPVRMNVREGGVSMHSGLEPLSYVYKVALSLLVTLFRKIPENWRRVE